MDSRLNSGFSGPFHYNINTLSSLSVGNLRFPYKAPSLHRPFPEEARVDGALLRGGFRGNVCE